MNGFSDSRREGAATFRFAALLWLGTISIAAGEYQDGDWSFSVTSASTATITAYYGSDTVLTIPSVVVLDEEYQEQDDDGEWQTRYRTHEYSVTAIGEWLFSYCSGLTSVTIPDGVTDIGNGAFYLCGSLASVTMPDSVTRLGWHAFCGCSELTLDKMPDSVKYIGGRAFAYCEKLTLDRVPDGVTYIEEGAFYGCDGLTAITIPDSVTAIGIEAFSCCTNLAEVGVGNGVRRIEERTFYCCSGLKLIAIPDSITYIGDEAFCLCSNLVLGAIPDSVTHIGRGAFDDCENLTLDRIPDGVVSIDAGAFWGCVGLPSITIPDSVTSIGDAAFSRCTGLTAVSIGSGVTRLADHTFSYCTNLTSVTLASGVTSIGDFSFCECYSLSSVENLDRVTSIGYGAFWACTGLVSLAIGNGVTRIEDETFRFCCGLTSIVIPEGVTYIGEAAFEGCSNLVLDVMPSHVEDIGRYAFCDCSGLTLDMIPNSVTNIGDHAFCGCSGLSTIEIGSHVETIGYSAFGSCESLSSVAFSSPNSVTNIGDSAFAWCDSLISISIPDKVTCIGTSTFEGCCSLLSIMLPNSVTNIGDNAFFRCHSLRSVIISDNATRIGNNAFYECTELTSITIPSSMKRIEKSAFQGCYALFDVYFRGEPPRVGGSAFANTGLDSQGTPSARGHYPLALESVWQPQIGSDGKWKGLTMSSSPDYNVRLHGNGATTTDGADWIDVPMVFGKDRSLPDNPFSKAKGDSPVFPSRDISYALLGWWLGSGTFNWKTDKNIIPPNEVISAGESQLLDWARLGWADVINGIPTVHLYAVWQSEIQIRFCGANGDRLEPQSLESAVKTAVNCDDDWRMGEETYLLPPGCHRIGVKLEWGFDNLYTIQVWIGNSLISPVGDSFWDFVINSVDGPQRIELQIRLDTSADLGFVQFDGRGRALTSEQKDAWPMFPPFDPSMVDISVFASEGSAWGGMPVAEGAILALPVGTYQARIDYKDRPGEYCPPFWMCTSTKVDVVVLSGEWKTIPCDFLPFGSTQVNAYWVSFDGNGGTVVSGKTFLWWFGRWWSESFSGRGTFSDYPLPEFRRAGGWKFVEWNKDNDDSISITSLEELDRLLQYAPGNLNLKAHWKPVQAATGTDELVPCEWLDTNAATILANSSGDYELAAASIAANGRPVWECYVADLDPEDAFDDLVANIEMSNGKPEVTVVSGESSNRVYTVQGTRTMGGAWDDLDDGVDWDAAGYRFFRVKVILPE